MLRKLTFHLGLEDLQKDAIGRQLMKHTPYELQGYSLGAASQGKTILPLPGVCAAQADAAIYQTSEWMILLNQGKTYRDVMVSISGRKGAAMAGSRCIKVPSMTINMPISSSVYSSMTAPQSEQRSTMV